MKTAIDDVQTIDFQNSFLTLHKFGHARKAVFPLICRVQAGIPISTVLSHWERYLLGNAAHSGVSEVLLFSKSNKWKTQLRKKWPTGRLPREAKCF